LPEKIKSLPWLSQGRQFSVAIIGDIILDEYIEGDVSRISPEAPVPVLLVTDRHFSAGGAANTALNIQLAGGQARLFGVWGEDEAATNLASVLARLGLDKHSLIKLEDRPTIRKTRVTTKNQQMIRIDWEKVHPIAEDIQSQIFQQLRTSEFDAILISDYGKGTLPAGFISKIIQFANETQKPVIVDPKGKDFSRYKGADLITPNFKEACEALGLDPTEPWVGEDLGKRLQAQYQLRDVLITMGARGMVLVPKESDRKPIYHKPKAREVFDVSGAGDTVAAIISLALACGSEYEAALELANLAAGIVVEKWGTQPITRGELEEALHQDQATSFHFATGKKILDFKQLLELRFGQSLHHQKIVFTNGCFDILHSGHIEYLEAARGKGDFLIVGVNSDESVRRLKGPSRPINRLSERMRLLASLACVDYVVSFDDDTPLKLIEGIRPDVLIKGADYQIEDIVGAKSVLQHGGSVETIALVPGASTTEIIKRIKSD
jgi:D-beta-D-heptose 7-phosphate kinase/D-beta-D-heptose 1-phosphate adenosyltransferase